MDASGHVVGDAGRTRGHAVRRGLTTRWLQLTPEQKLLVQESFALVAPIADTAGALFYDRLFELDPSLRALFHTDIREQRHKLMQTLAIAVRSLDNLTALVPALHALGRRHVDYGVTDRHFAVVGEALLWTLERGLGEAFTDEVRNAWAAVYAIIVRTMQDGMRQSSERAAA
jgi:hemoglobin-like flavoprotein